MLGARYAPDFRFGRMRKIADSSCVSRKINLAPIGLPITVTVMSDAWRVYRRNCDAGTQGIVDRFIQVRVLQIPGTVEAVNSVRSHDDRAPRRGRGPALHQIGQRKIRAAISPSRSQR